PGDAIVPVVSHTGRVTLQGQHGGCVEANFSSLIWARNVCGRAIDFQTVFQVSSMAPTTIRETDRNPLTGWNPTHGSQRAVRRHGRLQPLMHFSRTQRLD